MAIIAVASNVSLVHVLMLEGDVGTRAKSHRGTTTPDTAGLLYVLYGITSIAHPIYISIYIHRVCI